MREIVLGTAGHVDHGKTSLVRALTGIETDRLKEEQKRGITIELGFAYLDLPCGHRLGIVDVPGHEKFVKNMVAGVNGIDILAFIIAADEGIMPQTIEHFEICRLLGVQKGFIVLTKIDLVDEDWLEMVEDEIRQFCEDSFLEDAEIIHVSSTKNQGIDDVRDKLDKMVSKHDFSEVFGPFRLPVDRVFAMKGFGAVVTGTSISGRVALGDELQFYPNTVSAKIRGIQVHSETVEEVEAGHRTAINFQGVDTADIGRGMVAASPGTLEPNYMLDCEFLYLGSNPKPLKHRARIRLHMGTIEVMGRISLLDRDELFPGDETCVQLLLEEPVVSWPGDRYVIRSYSPVITIGGGSVIGNVSPKKRKRLSEKDREYNVRVMSVLRGDNIEEKAIALLQESGGQGLTFDELGIRLGLFGKHLKKTLNIPLSTKKIAVVDSSTQRYVARNVADEVESLLVDAIKTYHTVNPLQEGISKEELRTSLDRKVDLKVYNYVINSLIRTGTVVQDESLVRMTGHEVALKADEEELQRDLERWYKEKGLFTPTLKETREHFSEYSESLLKEVVNLLIREDKVVKISETLYYDTTIINKCIDDVQEYILREGEIDAPGFKKLTGLTRKFSIPILEYLDKVKLTIRVGDKRILRRKQ